MTCGTSSINLLTNRGGVRVVVDDQVGYAYSEDLTPEALVAAARAAAEIASGTPGRTAANPLARAIPDLYPVAQPWDAVGMGDRVKMVRGWEQAAFAADPRVQRIEAYLAWDNVNWYYAPRNPDGNPLPSWGVPLIGSAVFLMLVGGLWVRHQRRQPGHG